MGLLKESKTYNWEETIAQTPAMKRRGAEYFSEAYHLSKDVRTGKLLWGEELEQNIVLLGEDSCMLLLCAENTAVGLKDLPEAVFNVEYAGYMIESTPRRPYAPTFEQFMKIERGMEKRRRDGMDFLRKNISEHAKLLFLPCFPLLGTPFAFGSGKHSPEKWESLWIEGFEQSLQASPEEAPQAADTEKAAAHTLLGNALERARVPEFRVTRSIHFPDFAITQHDRFRSFTCNIRERRGRSLHLSIPVLKQAREEKQSERDMNRDTDNKHIEEEGMRDGGILCEREKDSVVIDSMGQGMGCCCLQITLQSECLSEARSLYDAIGSICPLLLALTMATSVVSGKVVGTSTRWEIVSASVDCRKREETHIHKSRYSSIDLYVSEMDGETDGIYNDIDTPIHNETMDLLLEKGVDRALARHVASLYTRDPVLCYKESSPREDFENIQSSNWRSMRLKPPVEREGDTGCPGWLVETRPMEIQPTSFENTAYSIFVVLFSRTVLSLKANFYLPISKVDENFKAATEECGEEPLFWYRENILEQGPPVIKKGPIEEIFCGSGGYCGIFGAIDKYLEEYSEERGSIKAYLVFLRERVTGKKRSVAEFLRSFVFSHPKYKGDGVVSPKISRDLVAFMCNVTEANSSEYLDPEYEIKHY
jgi:glutamate--cysteine ligase catalytic subunit